MPYGYNGKILRVNLTSRLVTVEGKDWAFYRTYLGGRGIIAYYLLNEVPAGADPLGDENKIVFAASVMTGSPLAGFGRHSIGAKSPLTNFYGESEAGGYWGAELKFAGYDAIVVEGKAEKPVYLWINDGEVEIRAAENLWGMDTADAKEAIIEELGIKQLKALIIGKAGENMVRYAGVASDITHFHGRSGMGAVMGSKMLKAVAVRGTRKMEFANPEKVKEYVRYFSENYKNNEVAGPWQEYGTSQLYFMFSAGDSLPTKNFTTGHFEGADRIGLEETHKLLKVRTESCYACPVKCKMVFEANEPYKIDSRYGGPEYETIGAFNSSCGVNDIRAAAKAHELCNKYGLDSISTGVTIAFAMECYEKGLITREDTDGIELEFGNAQAMLEMVEKIASRDGFGDLLAEGSKRAAQKIGKESEKFSIHVKGREFAMHEPRTKFGVGLAYALSPTGANHLEHEHDPGFTPAASGDNPSPEEAPGLMKSIHPMGILEPVKNLYLGPEKVRLFTYLQSFWSIFNCLDMCIFNFSPGGTYKTMQIVEMIKAVTGWDISLWELMKVGERTIAMTRCFNIKHGLTRKDDTLPDRMFEALEGGSFKGSKLDRDEFDRAVSLYYEMMGWDRNEGVPTEGRLHELSLGWALSHIGKE